MAQSLTTDQGVAFLAGAYPTIKVQKNDSSLAATGVVVLVGEADAGPDFSLETDITQNFFSPDDVGSVLAKYKSGPLVEAYAAGKTPANDPDITGAPAAFYLIKTNPSVKASGSLVRAGLSNYAVLADKSYGDLGNLIYGSVASNVAEVAPTTGQFTYTPSPSAVTLAARVNGGVKQTLVLSAKTIPSTFVGTIASGSTTGLNSLTGVLATGGVDRGVISGATTATLALAASGNNVTITLGVVAAWVTTPSVGDTLLVTLSGDYGTAASSAVIGAGNANAGAYVVTAATSTTISATKLRSNTTGALVAPVNVSATLVSAGTKDILCFSPAQIKNVTGTDRGILTGLTGINVTGTAAGQSLTLTLATGSVWAALPQVGDQVFMPSTAPAAWHNSGANGGWYQVTAATSGTSAGASTVIMTRLSNGAPASFAATAIAATTDLQCLRPAIDGLGKSIELYDGGNTDNVNVLAYALSSTLVSFWSTALAPYLLTSTSEYKAALTVSRASDGITETYVAGGDVVLKFGYKGTSGTVTIGATTLTTTVVGGSGANLSINLAKFKTLADLANYINSQTGYSCLISSTLFGQFPVVVAGASTLDQGTYSIGSDFASPPARIKKDAYAFYRAIVESSTLSQLGVVPAAAVAGLPEAQGTFYFSGGSKGGTTAATVSAALAACEKLRCNFIVPLFSRDSTADIADGLTESSSSYLIDDVNAAVKSHLITMATFKRRRNRQGFASKRDTFTNIKIAAGNLAYYRMALCFQDFKTVAVDGTIKQFQPWMGAVLAASMQAAAFYRSILFKGINCSGVLMADGSFSDALDPNLEDAVKNGLMVAQRVETGGFRWNNDQTTYGIDDSFYFNSCSAVYNGDTIALTIAKRMEAAFVGASLADVSASVALSYLKGILSDLKRLKLIVGDDDAKLGFKDAKIQINGNTMRVSLTVKESTSIVFIPIAIQLDAATSSASTP